MRQYRPWLLLLMVLLLPTLAWSQGLSRREASLLNPLEYGTTCTTATLNAAISGAPATGRVLMLTPVTRDGTPCVWAITSNVTVPTTLVLHVPHGASATISAGVTLTLQRYPRIDNPSWKTGAGALIITEPDPRTGMVNVRDYGATGDGTTDDATAITNAIATLPSTGGTVFFPHGTYAMGSGIDLVDKRNITLRGASSARRAADTQAATLKYTASSGKLISFNGATGITVEGLNLAYSHAAYTDTLISVAQGTGVQDATEISFISCRIGGITGSSGAADTLLRIAEESYDVLVDRCVFLNGATAIKGSTTSVINANNVVITKSLFLPTFTVAHITPGGSQWNIRENTFEPRTGTLGSAIFITSAGVDSLSITGNLFLDANSATTTWIQLTAGVAQGVHIAGNYFQDVHPSSTAISLGSAVGVTITGNYFNTGFHVVAGSASDVTMTGNFHGGGTTPISAYPAGQNLINDNATFSLGASAAYDQTSSTLNLRNPAAGNSLEWGHSNASGFASTLGNETATGKPFVALSAEAGTNANTYRTRGKVGRVLLTDNAGALLFAVVPTATGDNQSATTQMTLASNGALQLEGAINRLNGVNVVISGGAGSPEGVVTGGVGSIFLRTDGGAGTSLYVKESGGGNTGWVAK